MKYARIETFHGGIAAAMFRVWGIIPRWHHIDEHMRPLYEHSFQRVERMHEGYSIAKDGKGWCHINNKGEPLYDRRFPSIFELEAFEPRNLDSPAIGYAMRRGGGIIEVSLNRRSGKVSFSDTGETVQGVLSEKVDLHIASAAGKA